MVTLEVCAESVESAMTAAACGASRIEFCDNMAEGGTTQSYGSIKVLKEALPIKLFPIIRPRGGDFIYTDAEFGAMRLDVEFCGRCGCDGVVFGVLLPDGTVDRDRTRTLVEIAVSYGMEVTFHRAFDACLDLRQALEDIIACGCTRVLTSGGAETAPEGIPVIKELVEQAAGRIVLMPGSGVTPENAAGIILQTGCTEIHGTFRSRTDSESYKTGWTDFSRWKTDPVKVKKVVENLSHL